MKLISLFDRTGLALLPWVRDGHECYTVDVQDAAPSNQCQHFQFEISDAVEDLIVGLAPDGIFSFPPCTDLSKVGNSYWAEKALKDPDFQKKAIHLARTAERIGERLGVNWLAENPVGALSTQWRKPDFTFIPADYGGYLPENDVHPLYPKYYPPRDAYRKTTCFWIKGWKMPPKRMVELLDWNYKAMSQLGGSNPETKNIRSATPRGIFEGIYLFNQA